MAAVGADDPSACTTSAGNPCTPPLSWHGNYVQNRPKVYLIFWGLDWKTNQEEKKVASALTTMFTNLPGTAWNNILSQYNGSTAYDYPHNDQPVYAGSWIDTSNPNPVDFGVTQNVGLPQAENEITNTALAANPSWQSAYNADNNDQQFMVIPEQGTSYDGVTIDSKTCGIHDNANGALYVGAQQNLNFSVVRVGTDNPCTGEFPSSYPAGDSTDQTIAAVTSVASHEYAETVTDPAGKAWTTNDPTGDWWNPTSWSSPPEIGDLCEGLSPPGSWDPSIQAVVQELWDNSDYYASTSNRQNNVGCVSQRGQDFKQDPACASLATHTVYGNMLADYYNVGGDTGVLGCPTSESEPYQAGAEQTFQNGAIYQPSWYTDTGAAALWGQIATDAANDYVVGASTSIGWPSGDEHPIASCSCDEEADFPGGAFISDGTVGNTGWIGSPILAAWKNSGGPTGGLGLPTGNQFGITGGSQVNFQNGAIIDYQGAIQVLVNGQWVVGHAAHAGNDYPYETVGQFDHQNQGIDAWNEYFGQCDSFAAWKVYENLAGSQAQTPNIPVPAVGWRPSNASINPVDQNSWFNADNWDVMARNARWTVNTIPAPGAIAYWPNATTDPQDGHPTSPNGIGEFGHVGYVSDVYPDGSVTIESYNLRLNGEYSTIHMAYGQSAVDTSFNHSGYTVPWPTYFIHVGDGVGSSTPASPEPGNGTVFSDYPSQVKVIGPGSNGEFSTGDVWYLDSGHGETGQELWTHTNGATAVSTATWTPSGLAGSACYRVDALVPNDYSDNPVTVYTVSDTNGSHMAAVNENVHTNDWAELGVYETNSSGGITVRLDDRGTTDHYVAADAMRFWRQTSCGSYGDVAPIIMPTYQSSGWAGYAGHGFFGTMTYSATSGNQDITGNTATWAPVGLLANTCYEVHAYVPDEDSDNNGAVYHVNDYWFGNYYPQVNENVFTNQFTDLGGFMTDSSGALPVTLQSNGPSDQYVAADALAYTPDPGCEGPAYMGPGTGTPTGLGGPYASNQIGPGSSPDNFWTANPWYTQLGHGYSYHELWTYDNGATSDSTATWVYKGTANTCYNIQAFIPNNYADNPSAHYTIETGNGSTSASLNQANLTGWSSLTTHVQTSGDGYITITLDDTGPTADYTAADAMEFDPIGC